MELLLSKKISSFFTRRAEQFSLLRKKPVSGYDISFLITAEHLETFDKNLVIDWILEVVDFFFLFIIYKLFFLKQIQFVENMDKEIAELRLNLNTQSRIVASYFVNAMAGREVCD